MPWLAQTLPFAADILAAAPFSGTLHVFSQNNVRLDHIYFDTNAGLWRVDYLDIGCTTQAPEQISAVQLGNELHVFYRACSPIAGYGIRHARLSQGGWSFETLDPNPKNCRGVHCAATVFNGELHVFDSPNGVGIYHAWRDKRWRFEVLDDKDAGCSTGIGAATTVFRGRELHVFSSPNFETGIRWGKFDGKWQFQKLDVRDSFYPYAAVEFGGDLHVFATPLPQGKAPTPRWPGIRHGVLNGRWYFHTLDGGLSAGVKAAVVYGNRLDVFSNTPSQQVQVLNWFGYASPSLPSGLTGAEWQLISPPSAAYERLRLGPNLSIETATRTGIRHGFWAGRWQFETLDPDGSGMTPTIAATVFRPPGKPLGLNVFTWSKSSVAPADLRHTSFVP